MLTILIAIYRAWPLRPHCRSAIGAHAWPCRLATWVTGPRLDCRPINPDPNATAPRSDGCWHEHPER